MCAVEEEWHANSSPCMIKRQGICPKYYGQEINYKNGQQSNKCQGGRWQRRFNRRSSAVARIIIIRANCVKLLIIKT